MPKEKPGPLDAAIGAHLHGMRLKAGFSQKAIALALDVQQQLVHKQERGSSRISIAQLLRLAAVYGKTLAQLTAEMALDHPNLRSFDEPETARYEAPSMQNHEAGGEFAREPFLLNLAQLRDPAERKAVLDLFSRFKQRQSD